MADENEEYINDNGSEEGSNKEIIELQEAMESLQTQMQSVQAALSNILVSKIEKER